MSHRGTLCVTTKGYIQVTASFDNIVIFKCLDCQIHAYSIYSK